MPKADPPDNLRPMDSAANRSKPPAGLTCPACGGRLTGPVPKPDARRLRRKYPGSKVGHVYSVRLKPGALIRVRRCVRCGHRCLTREEIVSRAV